MKKINIILSVFLIVSFSACRFQLKDKISIDNNEIIPEEKIELSQDESYITFNLLDGYNSGRTALPSFEWNDFEYTLSAYINGSRELTTLVSQKPYTAFNEQKLTIKKAKYNFVLTGYMTSNEASAVSVIQGVSDEIDLNEGAKEVVFRMYALSGDDLYGKAEITITLPNDGVIKTIKACVKNSRSVSEGDLVDLTSSLDAATNTLVYKPENIPAGKTQYALVYFYDENGGCITNLVESLIIVAGKTSYSSRTISANNYHRYDVSIKFIIEKEDGEAENIFTSRTLKVIGEDGKEYTLVKQADGSYEGTLTEQKYTVIYNDKNTGVAFTSPTSSNVIRFKEIGLPESGISLDNIKNGLVSDDGSVVLVPETDESFTADVVLKPGYEIPGGGNTVTVDGNTVTVPGNITVSAANKENITAGGVTTITYTITYSLSSDESWVGNAENQAIKTYTVEDEVLLPSSNDLHKDGAMLDGWENEVLGRIVRITKGTTGNYTFTPVWKDGVKVDEPENGETPAWENKDLSDPKNFTVAPSVFACGYSLIVKWSDMTNGKGETNIYIDYNGNGEIDDGDEQVTGAYVKSTGAYTGTDFSGYKLEAKNKDGTLPASDFKFTILGGKLASLTGLGFDAPNQSVVNIGRKPKDESNIEVSKNIVIGNAQVDGITKEDIIGVDLSSLSNEWINIEGQMEGDYYITMETKYVFNRDEPTHKVAYIQESKFAQTSKFTCINKTSRDILGLGFSNISESGQDKIIIYLKDPSPISLPGKELSEKNGGIHVIERFGNQENGEVKQFSLGDATSISESCSVFSLSVKNGTFKLKDTKMYKENGAPLSTINLGQKSATAFDENTLSTSTEYIYLHMFSDDNMITALRATEFLKNVTFIKAEEGKDIEITVNLESIPYDEIGALKETYGKAFDYYNGSFYLGISGRNEVQWDISYNEAKKIVFNGLNGYLVSITSEVENEYITGKMGIGVAWTGGSRMHPTNGYDEPEFVCNNMTGGDSYWTWQCGPDAGRKFYNGTGSSSGAIEGEYTNWMEGEPNASTDSKVSENCLHIIGPNNIKTGIMNTITWYAHKWNDFSYKHKDGTTKAQQGYIVEFTPYEYTWNNETKAYDIPAKYPQKANYPSIKTTVSY